MVRHSELLQKGFFYRNHQVAAKCCKIVSFAANGITSKVLQQSLPNLIYRASLAFWIDSEWFLSQKMMAWCKMLQNSIFCSKLYKFRNIAIITSKLGMHGLLGILNWFSRFLSQKFSTCCKIVLFAANSMTIEYCSNLIIFEEKPVWIFSTWQSNTVYQVWK